MSDNAKFCMECGVNLSDFSSSGVKVRESVGSVNISPTFMSSNSELDEDICPKCGFKMKEVSGKYKDSLDVNDIDIKYEVYIRTDAYVCPKCKYKCLYSEKGVRFSVTSKKCLCGEVLTYQEGVWPFDNKVYCKKCGSNSNGYSPFQRKWEERIPVKRALKNIGWEPLF